MASVRVSVTSATSEAGSASGTGGCVRAAILGGRGRNEPGRSKRRGVDGGRVGGQKLGQAFNFRFRHHGGVDRVFHQRRIRFGSLQASSRIDDFATIRRQFGFCSGDSGCRNLGIDHLAGRGVNHGVSRDVGGSLFGRRFGSRVFGSRINHDWLFGGRVNHDRLFRRFDHDGLFRYRVFRYRFFGCRFFDRRFFGRRFHDDRLFNSRFFGSRLFDGGLLFHSSGFRLGGSGGFGGGSFSGGGIGGGLLFGGQCGSGVGFRLRLRVGLGLSLGCSFGGGSLISGGLRSGISFCLGCGFRFGGGSGFGFCLDLRGGFSFCLGGSFGFSSGLGLSLCLRGALCGSGLGGGGFIGGLLRGGGGGIGFRLGGKLRFQRVAGGRIGGLQRLDDRGNIASRVGSRHAQHRTVGPGDGAVFVQRLSEAGEGPQRADGHRKGRGGCQKLSHMQSSY